MELIPKHIRDESRADLAIKLAKIEFLRSMDPEDAAVGPRMLKAAEVATRAFQPIAIVYNALSHVAADRKSSNALTRIEL